MSDISKNYLLIISRPLALIVIFILALSCSCKDNITDDPVNNTPVILDADLPEFIPIGFTDTLYFYLFVEDLQGPQDIEDAYFMRDNRDSTFNTDTLYMYDTGLDGDNIAGDGVFTYGVTSNDLPQEMGDYIYRFEAVDKDDAYAEPLERIITFNDEQGPYLYNLLAPDSLRKGSSDPEYMFIRVWDSRGLDFIDSVYFTVMRPDSTSSGYRFVMYDDGAVISHGDSIAGDGIYSLGIMPPAPENQSGVYTFTYEVTDIFHNHGNIIFKHIVAYDETTNLLKNNREYSPAFRVTNVW